LVTWLTFCEIRERERAKVAEERETRLTHLLQQARTREAVRLLISTRTPDGRLLISTQWNAREVAFLNNFTDYLRLSRESFISDVAALCSEVEAEANALCELAHAIVAAMALAEGAGPAPPVLDKSAVLRAREELAGYLAEVPNRDRPVAPLASLQPLREAAHACVRASLSGLPEPQLHGPMGVPISTLVDIDNHRRLARVCRSELRKLGPVDRMGERYPRWVLDVGAGDFVGYALLLHSYPLEGEGAGEGAGDLSLFDLRAGAMRALLPLGARLVALLWLYPLATARHFADLLGD
jgi:hypothetical protein